MVVLADHRFLLRPFQSTIRSLLTIQDYVIRSWLDVVKLAKDQSISHLSTLPKCYYPTIHAFLLFSFYYGVLRYRSGFVSFICSYHTERLACPYCAAVSVSHKLQLALPLHVGAKHRTTKRCILCAVKAILIPHSWRNNRLSGWVQCITSNQRTPSERLPFRSQLWHR